MHCKGCKHLKKSYKRICETTFVTLCMELLVEKKLAGQRGESENLLIWVMSLLQNSFLGLFKKKGIQQSMKFAAGLHK